MGLADKGIYPCVRDVCELPGTRAMFRPPGMHATSLSQALAPKVRAILTSALWGSPVWRKALTLFGEFRRRTDAGRLRTTGAIPIGIVVALAIVCVVGAVLTAARRADDVQLQQERLLLTNAIADRGHRMLRELENVAAAHDVVYQLHYNFDRDWVHHLVGLRLNTFFDHDHVFVTDGADRLVYALQDNASVSPTLFDNAEFGRVIDLLRGRALPNKDEHFQEPSLDPITNLGHPRGVQRLQSFRNRPAIVAGVVGDLPALA